MGEYEYYGERVMSNEWNYQQQWAAPSPLTDKGAVPTDRNGDFARAKSPLLSPTSDYLLLLGRSLGS